jgi:hypothetical protein
MRKVEMGMTKAEIIQIVGTAYNIASSSIDDNGNAIEVISYKNTDSDEYFLKLINNKLVELKKEHIYNYKVESPPAK